MVIAGASWGTVGFDVIDPAELLTGQQTGFLLAVAVCSSAFLMMRCYQRPLGVAYDMGYEAGRRDALLEANHVSSRRLVELHRRQVSERARLDA